MNTLKLYYTVGRGYCLLALTLLAFLMIPFPSNAIGLYTDTCSATPASITDVTLANSGAAGEESYLKSLFAADSPCHSGIYYKFDNWSGVETGLKTPDGIVTITDANAMSFDWSSTMKVCAVMVKGGQSSKIYKYNLEDCSCSGNDLIAPNNNGGNQAAISHVSFLYSNVSCNPVEKCYNSETAWAEGARYVKKGNWATFVDYRSGGSKTVTVFAGQTLNAGIITLNESNGNVEVKIQLNNGFVFYYPASSIDDNIKIQGYSSMPSGNPAPGLFSNKYSAQLGQTSYTVTVPKSNFYGIHLDVAQETACMPKE